MGFDAGNTMIAFCGPFFDQRRLELITIQEGDMKRSLCICLLLLLVGCATTQNQADIPELGVTFTWKDTQRCSKISPEIRISAIPAGTQSFSVKLKDLDAPRWNHGGGAVANDGSGIIPSGALQKGYNGPCPPSGSHRYKFTVKALGDDGRVVGTGSAIQNYP